MMNNANKMIYKIPWRNRPEKQKALFDSSQFKEDFKFDSNCKNCGAPLHSNKCEYCGTEY